MEITIVENPKAKERATEATVKADEAKEALAQAESRTMEMKTSGESLNTAIEAKAATQPQQTQPPCVETFDATYAQQPRQAGALND